MSKLRSSSSNKNNPVEVNLKTAGKFGEAKVTAFLSKACKTHVYYLECFGGHGFLFVYILSNFLLMVI